MIIPETVTDELLENHNCLERVDRVPGNPEVTAFKRKARLWQSLWREYRDYPVGSQPIRPKHGQKSRPLGNRIECEYAWETGSNFLNEAIRNAVRERLEHPQNFQTLDGDRLYCDLLSSMPMCFNLFGDLWADLELADQVVHAWWPDLPGRVVATRFEWSPGRAIPGKYLENRSAFDVAFELELEKGSRGILGIETKYHEHCKKDKIPFDKRLERYSKVTIESQVMSVESMRSIVGTELQQIWLDHLLALSMLQDSSDSWEWATFVLVHPARNPSYARAAERYRAHLKDESTFQVSTIESLVAAEALPMETRNAFSERYLWK